MDGKKEVFFGSDRFPVLAMVIGRYMYSETCEIRTPLGQVKSVPYSEVSSFQRAIFTEDSWGPDEVSLFHRMSSFRRVAFHRFHCISFTLILSGKTFFYKKRNVQ
jgi:hypothetical protein